MNWHSLHQGIEPYLIRIETPQGAGTGFLFAYNEDKSIAAIATAAHVVDYSHDWKQPIKLVHHTTGDDVFLSDADRVIFLDRKRDSASIIIKADFFDFPKDVLPLMDPAKYKRVGVEVAWLGFPSVAYPELCFFTGCISAFLMNDDCYLIDGVAINGVSGGPVFAEIPGKGSTPEIIGSISAYMPNRVAGTTLPGLLRAQDISAFQDTIRKIKNLDEARKKEREEAKKAEEARQTEQVQSLEPKPIKQPDKGT